MCVGYTTIGLLAKLDTALVYEAKDSWFESKIDCSFSYTPFFFRSSVIDASDCYNILVMFLKSEGRWFDPNRKSFIIVLYNKQ